MKIIISENKLDSYIYNFIDNYYNVDEINYSEFFDDDGNPTDAAYEFYIGDFDYDSDNLFRLYNKHYWKNPDFYRVELSPMLMIEDENFVRTLNTMFGDKWQDVFISWFKENFDFDVKTIDFY